MNLIKEGESKELIKNFYMDLNCVNPKCRYGSYVDGGGIHKKPSGSIYELLCPHCKNKWRVKVTIDTNTHNILIEEIN